MRARCSLSRTKLDANLDCQISDQGTRCRRQPMSSRDDSPLERPESNFTETPVRRWRTIRPRRPASLLGWLLLLLIALLSYLLISYVLVPWWYRPVPTDIPPAMPNSNTRRTS